MEKQVRLIPYKLKLSHAWQRLHLVFNVVKLITVPKDPILEQKTTVVLILVIVEGEKEWKVEEILNSQWH